MNSKIAKRSALPGKLKPQLQAKSQSRRKDAADKTQVAAAVSRPGRNDLQPHLEAVWRPIESLKPAPGRARKTTPEQLERVVTSIQQFGMVVEILIDKEDRIVAGHILWEACRLLGAEKIACKIVDHLDENELKALSLALNRIAETGTWDFDLLRDSMIEIEAAGIEITSTGFTLNEVDQITLAPAIPDQEGEEVEDDDRSDEPITSRLGDLYELGDHRLLCGDALDEASYRLVLAMGRAQCAVSDPPYNCRIAGFVSGLGQNKHDEFVMASGEMDGGQFTGFLKTYLQHCATFTSLGAIIFACMDWRQIEKLLVAGSEVGLTRNNIVVWNKGSGGMGSLYRSAHEFIAVFCNGSTPATNAVELGRHGRDRTNVFSYPGANRRGSSASAALADHPTPKPVEMVVDMLLDVTKRGDVVLDPFSGSGTTLIAAEHCRRNACAIELDPKYVDRSIRRWEALTGREAIHTESGMTFSELMAARSGQNDADHANPGDL
ncbi:site-specific DNA-methyltransferase [Novosphingobium aquiterrae]|uniref:Methyltransferase n=1 Tax=Novosphingobium aquiterrae TaxID=624388 RepID=A0ABV6PFZ7_9SPHN